ncbi:MAG TPA: sigma-70 family RNA polymerase sigma factor [Acidimicrobiales bacterium]|nr:sigma-70 family RNA polymerase sigma factor [Acidimicrobiales bacterium]
MEPTRANLRDASDASLVVGIARYRQDALAEVYRRHAGSVFALARRVTADAAIAEEVVQEVLLRLWENPDRFDSDRGTLRSFLLTQAHSRAVDSVRSETSRRRRESTDSARTATAGYDLEREVWDLAMAEQVRSALHVLPSEERDAIELAYFGGHSYRTVAVMLEQPEGTVKSRIRSGLRRLRSEMQAAGVVGAEA